MGLRTPTASSAVLNPLGHARTDADHAYAGSG
jgi:hypothetical protein